MAAGSLQSAGTSLLEVYLVPNSLHCRQRTAAPQELPWGGSRVWMANCFLAKPLDVSSQAERGRQEHLWRKFFLDPTLWWDNRQDKKSSRSPDFTHKQTSEPLCLDNFYKPAWVDAQLTMLDSRIRRPVTPTSTSIWPIDPGPLTVGRVTVETVSKLCEKGQLSEAVDALGVLVQTGSRVSAFLLYSVLQSCLAQKNLAQGRRVHHLTVGSGYQENTFLANHILRMYAAQGQLQEAMDVFTRVPMPDAFMWSSIISAHAKHGNPKQAIRLYHMMRRTTVKADSHVFVAVLQACAMAADLESGRQVHADVLENRVRPNSFVCNSLVDMYAKCNSMEDARRVFDSLAKRTVVIWTAMIAGYAKCGMLNDARMLFDSVETRDVVTWNAMIAGYVEHGYGQDALALYEKMEQEGLIVADGFTFACLLKACARVGALQRGKQVHSQIVERGLLDADVVLGSCLVELYAKCGRLEEARTTFNSLLTRNVVTWTAMMNGYGQCNESYKAIDCYQEMLRNGIRPNEATFTCLLVACSHEGLVNEGRQFFKAMVDDHGIVPTIEHHTCMIDLLGRAGHLDEAENMLLSFKANDVGFMALLNACRSHGDIDRGMRCFQGLVRLDPQKAGAYVLMANIYADAGRWTDVDRIETLRKLAGASKKPAMAGIEVNKRVRTFLVGEKQHGISRKVRSMNLRLKEEGGYVPHTELVLRPLSEEEKEDELCGHAEKLALAYGILNTPDGTPLLVTKNLRMCRDCHRSTEIMSRIEKREIVVRDAHRVHRFVGGSCHCGGRP